MKLKRFIAFAKPENIASNRIIEKLGFKFQHLVSGLPEELDFYNGEPYYLLRKEEYLQKNKREIIACLKIFILKLNV